MRRLRSRDRRALRIGFALALPLGLGIFVVRPLDRARNDLLEELARQEALLERELAILDAREELLDAWSDRLAFSAAVRTVSFEDDGALAGSMLTERIAAIARASRLEVISAQSRGMSGEGISAEAESVRLVELDVVLAGDWPSMIDFLTRLRQDAKYMRLSSFSLAKVGGVLDQGTASLQLTGRVAALVAPGSTATRSEESP